MHSPYISFVVPVYNASKTLEHCVKSLLAQTYDNFEIVLVDDGSVDGSSKICDDFAQKENRVVVCHQENAGVSAARNKGLELACGKYVTFVDADDWADSNVCETFVKACEKQDYDLFCLSAIYSSQKKNVPSFLFSEDIELLSQKQKEELLCKIMTPWAPWYSFNCNTRFAGSVWTKFFRAEVLKNSDIQFSPETIVSEDVLFNVLSFDSFDKIGFSTKAFYHYRVQDDSAQNRYRPNSMKYFGFVIDQIQQWLEEKRKDLNVKDCANTLFVHYLFGALKEDYFHQNNPNRTLANFELNEVLSQEKYKSVLENVKSEYLTLSERILVCLLRHKMVRCIKLLMKIYNYFS